MAKLPRADLIKHINRLIERWPKDEVRPNSVSVQRYLRNRLASPAPPTPPRSTFLSSLFSRRKNPQEAQTQSQTPLEPSQVPQDAPLTSFENIKALNSLLDNKLQKAYPLPRSLRHPKSQPDYYDRLLREFEEAPHRSWFGRLSLKARGFLRMK